MVLAGGAGERLYPLTKERAKPAVYFGGPYRIIDFTLSNCINSGLRRIFIATQYKSLSLSRHMRMGWSVVADELGEFIEILRPQKRVGEHWYLGTADAVYQNLYSIVREKPAAPDRAVRRSRLQDGLREDAALPHGARRRPRRWPRSRSRPRRRSRFGVLEVDDAGPGDRLPREAEGTSLAGRSQVLGVDGHLHLRHGRPGPGARSGRAPADRPTTSARTSSRRSIAKVPVYAYRFYDENKKAAKYWRDIGTLDAYYDANMDLCQVNPEFNLYDPEWPLRTNQPQAPPAKFVFADEGRRCGQALDSVISAGCIVSGSRVAGSVLCPNVRVHSFCDIEQSILMPGVRVGRHARIRRAIIDRDVFIPRGALIGYNPEEDRRRHTVTDSGHRRRDDRRRAVHRRDHRRGARNERFDRGGAEFDAGRLDAEASR